tara:strand:- start:11 stop:745 length:735 start_codon:yes stop_codon:yes gene_type:complete
MSKLYCDNDKYGYQCDFPISEAYNSAVKDLVRRSYEEFGGKWEDFVFKNEFDFIKKENMLEIESNLLDFGYKFEPSAMSSSRERPNAYKASDLYDEDFSFEHEEAPTSPVDKNGLELCGVGDNVVSHDSNFRGTALYVRTIDKVLECLEGVAERTIAIVDDSGGTLTAPVLQYFSGVLCAGGTARSHLAILTREYNIPCLMNVKLKGIKDGDQLELEVTAQSKTAEDYDAGRDVTANVWRLHSD